jgi:hypothetical protein
VRLADGSLARGEQQATIAYPEIGARRDHVDVVWLHLVAVLCFGDGHRGRPRQRLAEQARVRRIEVLDENERHPGVRR